MSDEKWIANRKKSDVLTEQTKINPQRTLKVYWSDQDKNSFLINYWF